MHVHVLNGVNLGMLGTREPDVYGKMAYNELESRIYAWSRELGLTARCMQTDHEGEYVQAIHESIRTAGALIVNPGAWTHYSYAIRDALSMLSTPVVEVHMSDVEQPRAVAPRVGDRGRRGPADRRPGRRWVPAGARVARAAAGGLGGAGGRAGAGPAVGRSSVAPGPAEGRINLLISPGTEPSVPRAD